MRSFLCCVMFVAAMARANPLPFNAEPANLDTPDDQDEVQTGVNAIPQGGSSFFVPAGSSSSSSSSEEVVYGSVDGSVGSIPAGTAMPGSGPVMGPGQGVGGSPQGEGQVAGGGQQGNQANQGNRGISDQNSGEVQAAGGMLVAGDRAKISKIQAKPKSNKFHSNAGTSAGIAIGVLLLVSVATVAIIFAIRKRRDGFMRFYTHANNEL